MNNSFETNDYEEGKTGSAQRPSFFGIPKPLVTPFDFCYERDYTMTPKEQMADVANKVIDEWWEKHKKKFQTLEITQSGMLDAIDLERCREL